MTKIHITRTPDAIRAAATVGSDHRFTILRDVGRPGSFTIAATVVENVGDGFILGVHPELLSVPFAAIVAIDGRPLEEDDPFVGFPGNGYGLYNR